MCTILITVSGDSYGNCMGGAAEYSNEYFLHTIVA